MGQQDQDCVPCRFKLAARFFLLAIFVGIGARVVGFMFNFPVTGEEAFLLNNTLHLNYQQLMGPLANGQTAPPVYAWLQRAMLQISPHEQWARLPSLFAGLAGLGLFWLVARAMLPRVTSLGATALFAVTYVPLFYSVRAKQYSFEMLICLLILYLTWQCLSARKGDADHPEKEYAPPLNLKPMLGLIILCPLGFWLSHTAMIAGAASGLGILIVFVSRLSQGRRGDDDTNSPSRITPSTKISQNPRTIGLLLVWLAASLISFFFLYQLSLRPSMSGRSADFLYGFWDEKFLPTDSIGAALRWLLEIHTGRLFSIPIGDDNYVSTPWFLLYLVGIVALLRAGAKARLALLILLLPQALGLLLSALALYPYGGDPRVTSYFIPTQCLLIAAGAIQLADWLRSKVGGTLLAAYALGLACYGLFALGFTIYDDAIRPDKPAFREVVEALGEAATNNQIPIVVLNSNAPLVEASKQEQIAQWYAHSRLGSQPLWLPDTNPTHEDAPSSTKETEAPVLSNRCLILVWRIDPSASPESLRQQTEQAITHWLEQYPAWQSIEITPGSNSINTGQYFGNKRDGYIIAREIARHP